jgi:hypothetical protein
MRWTINWVSMRDYIRPTASGRFAMSIHCRDQQLLSDFALSGVGF